jgi:hypothetical protein
MSLSPVKQHESYIKTKITIGITADGDIIVPTKSKTAKKKWKKCGKKCLEMLPSRHVTKLQAGIDKTSEKSTKKSKKSKKNSSKKKKIEKKSSKKKSKEKKKKKKSTKKSKEKKKKKSTKKSKKKGTKKEKATTWTIVDEKPKKTKKRIEPTFVKPIGGKKVPLFGDDSDSEIEFKEPVYKHDESSIKDKEEGIEKLAELLENETDNAYEHYLKLFNKSEKDDAAESTFLDDMEETIVELVVEIDVAMEPTYLKKLATDIMQPMGYKKAAIFKWVHRVAKSAVDALKKSRKSKKH